MLNIQIETNLKEVDVFLTGLKEKALVKSTRRSLNRTLSQFQTQLNRKIRQRRKLKASEIKRRFLRLEKAKGNMLRTMNAELAVSGDPVGLIRFVIGKKEPKSQAGIPVNKRKPITVQIRPGKRTKLEHVFIAKGKGGKNQVFRRKTTKSFPIVKQSTASLSKMVERPGFRLPLEKFASQTFIKEHERNFKFELSKLIR